MDGHQNKFFRRSFWLISAAGFSTRFFSNISFVFLFEKKHNKSYLNIDSDKRYYLLESDFEWTSIAVFLLISESNFCHSMLASVVKELERKPTQSPRPQKEHANTHLSKI